jgi:hypothetical protein
LVRLSIPSWSNGSSKYLELVWELVTVGSSKYPQLVRVGTSWSNGWSKYLELVGELFRVGSSKNPQLVIVGTSWSNVSSKYPELVNPTLRTQDGVHKTLGFSSLSEKIS